MTAGTTGPDHAIQALSQPPEWFVLGTVGSYHVAIDLVPGPAGKVGQVIGWTDEYRHDQPFGAELVADSLLDLVRLDRRNGTHRTLWTVDLPEYGTVTNVNRRSVEDVVSPELEVLEVARNSNPVRIAPAVGLPRLRTLTTTAGSIADPLEIGKLDKLEYLQTGVQEWRALLDAGTVPRSLLACKVYTGLFDDVDPHGVAAVLDRIRDLWGLRRTQQTVTIRGNIDLAPGARR